MVHGDGMSSGGEVRLHGSPVEEGVPAVVVALDGLVSPVSHVDHRPIGGVGGGDAGGGVGVRDGKDWGPGSFVGVKVEEGRTVKAGETGFFSVK